MKIKKEDVNVELRPYVAPLRVLNHLLSRRWGIRIMQLASRINRNKKIKGFENVTIFINGSDGHKVRVRLYRPYNQKLRLPAILFCHSGGFVVGSPEENHKEIERFLRQRPCVVFAPDYRKAPKNPYPAAFADCYDTLLSMKNHADTFNIISDRFIVVGYSAGGGLAIAISLKARKDRRLSIAFQIPIYPMVDDRQVTHSSHLENTPVWDAKNNALAWELYLANRFENNSEVPEYAAPARCENFKGLPPTISLVGALEPFKDEVVELVRRLRNDNVELQFKQFDGCFHAFDMVAPNTRVAKEAISFVLENFSIYYDRFFPNIDI